MPPQDKKRRRRRGGQKGSTTTIIRHPPIDNISNGNLHHHNPKRKKLCHDPKPSSSSSAQLLETRIVHAQSLGASLPPLIITYTNQQDAIATWLNQHVTDTTVAVGIDTETKPAFTREASLDSRGPDVIQLAVSDGNCLVVHLSRMDKYHGNVDDATATATSGTVAAAVNDNAVANNHETKNNNKRQAQPGFAQLSRVLNSQQIAKVGVSIDQDSLELFKNHAFGINCRLDLTMIDRNSGTKYVQSKNTNDNSTNNDEKEAKKFPSSLKGISEYYVPGMILPKIKRIQMSNWSLKLSDAQIGYAAADAFAGAIVVTTLVTSTSSWTRDALIAMVMETEVDISELQSVREQRKLERKKAAEKRRRERTKGKPKLGNCNHHGRKKKDKSNLKQLYPATQQQTPKRSPTSNININNNNQQKIRREKAPRTSTKRKGEEDLLPAYAQLQSFLSSPR